MAKMFYSVEETSKRLKKTPDELKSLVREGTLREFRDAGKANYKVEDVDRLATTLRPSPPMAAASSASATGEIVLEPAEDSGISLASAGSGALSLEEPDAADTAVGARTGRKSKEGTVAPSVGVNVFDDADLEEVVDPMAQTAISDVGGIGLEGVGSGSGILDLTRESDDTSLGAELLEEIYTGEEDRKEKDSGEGTRAGLEEALTAPGGTVVEEDIDAELEPSASERAVRVTQVVEFPPDAVSTALTASMIVAVAVLWIGGLAGAALVRGITPGLVGAIYEKLAIYSGAALLVAALAGGLTFFVSKRST